MIPASVDLEWELARGLRRMLDQWRPMAMLIGWHENWRVYLIAMALAASGAVCVSHWQSGRGWGRDDDRAPATAPAQKTVTFGEDDGYD